MTTTNPAAVAAALAAYKLAAKTCRKARTCFNRAHAAAKLVEPRAAVAEASADLAMQEATDGNLTLNDLRWSELDLPRCIAREES